MQTREQTILSLIEGEKRRIRKKIEKTKAKVEELQALKYYSAAINKECSF
jgi:hypothetical protein